jgi:hypothetical protein
MIASIIRMEVDMAAIDFGIDRSGYLDRLLGRLARLAGGRQTRRAGRLRIDELSAFGPALLDDLGICPGDIARWEACDAWDVVRRNLSP